MPLLWLPLRGVPAPRHDDSDHRRRNLRLNPGLRGHGCLLVVQYRPAYDPASDKIFGAALLLLSLVLLIVSLRFEQGALAKQDPPSLRQAVILVAALAEVPAIWGLLMYLLFGSIQWLVVGMTLSWALFFRLGTRLPLYLHRISQHLKPNA